MENNDKIYKQFEKAARRAEEQPFGRMDAVWNRVQDKLDHKRQRQIANYWKYTGMAALFLLFMTIGFVLVQNAEKEGSALPTPTGSGMTDAAPAATGIDTTKVQETFKPAVTNGAQNSVVINQRTAESNNYTISKDSITPASNALTWMEYDMSEKQEYEAQPEADAIAKDKAAPVAENAFTAPAPAAANLNNSRFNVAKAATNVAVESQGYFGRNTVKNYTEQDNEIAAKAKRQVVASVYTGVVYDQQALPLPGVTVTVKGTNISTMTDIDGKFSIQAEKGQVLVFTYLSDVKEVVLGDTLNLEITLLEAVLEEVVITSYKTTKKETISSAITTVTSASTTSRSTTNNARGMELKKISQTRKDEKVSPNAGYSANTEAEYGVDKSYSDDVNGTFVNKSTYDFSGGLGGTSAEPLYIVDGVAVRSKIIEEMNPAYVKSYKIIDDLDAVKVYGGRAVNGAIVIKTKTLSGTKKKEFKELIEEYRISDKDLNTFDGSAKIPVDSNESYGMFEENKFENTAASPLSTFSIDVDNASYTNIRRFLNNGQMVPKDAVRIEEMINFFKYNYPQPKGDDPFSINTEYSDCPWNPQHKLLKIGLKGKEMKKRELPASNFVFLIDVSGSMDEPNKLPLLKKNLRVLVNKMRGKDRIAIVVYAGAAEELLPSTSGYDRETILATIDKLEADGTTAGGDGIKLAYETAEDNFIEGGNNRVILATDGDFNVGPSSDRDMQDLIEEKRKSGVFLTCLGYGMGNYKDSKLETLADKGNGNYAYIDTEDEGKRYLGDGFNSAMYTIAKDVKIQIEFNPMLVQSYRLIGYENRKLQDEDFENDAIDAGELGSGHTVTALYEVIPAGVSSPYFTPEPQLKYTQASTVYNNFKDELATIKFRYKKPEGTTSMEMVQVVPNKSVSLGKSSADFKFAASVAWFGLKLRDSKLTSDKITQNIVKLAKEGLKNDDEGYKAEFIKLAKMVE
jgi:Ca-activated chloride channel homolog